MDGVYIKPDERGRIIDITSTEFLPSTVGWRQIAEGEGDRYYHAQGNFLPEDLQQDGVYLWMTDRIIPDREALLHYEHAGETWGVYRRTETEMQADKQAQEETTALNTNSRLSAVEEQIDMLLEGATSDE